MRSSEPVARAGRVQLMATCLCDAFYDDVFGPRTVARARHL